MGWLPYQSMTAPRDQHRRPNGAGAPREQSSDLVVVLNGRTRPRLRCALEPSALRRCGRIDQKAAQEALTARQFIRQQQPSVGRLPRPSIHQ